MDQEVNGFVIVGDTGLFLNRGTYWNQKPANRAYVFSVEKTNKILALAKKKKWPKMPKLLIPAKHPGRKNSKTEIMGPPRPAYPEK